MASLGCDVIIGARDILTAEAVIKASQRNNSKGKITFIPLDLADTGSIKKFAELVPFEKIDFLINNAGVMRIPERRLTKQGEEMQWGVNHLGHFYLTFLLWPKIKRSPNFRIINLSSMGHKKNFMRSINPTPDFDDINYEKSYDPAIAYGKSKLYNVLFTRALAQRIDPTRGKVLSVHPGGVRTDLTREMKLSIVAKIAAGLLYPVYWFITKNPWQGCQTTLYCALSDDVENGCYYADCKKDSENVEVTQGNWERLWDISEKHLGITFKTD